MHSTIHLLPETRVGLRTSVIIRECLRDATSQVVNASAMGRLGKLNQGKCKTLAPWWLAFHGAFPPPFPHVLQIRSLAQLQGPLSYVRRSRSSCFGDMSLYCGYVSQYIPELAEICTHVRMKSFQLREPWKVPTAPPTLLIYLRFCGYVDSFVPNSTARGSSSTSFTITGDVSRNCSAQSTLTRQQRLEQTHIIQTQPRRRFSGFPALLQRGVKLDFHLDADHSQG
jgi:hypothetical protein